MQLSVRSYSTNINLPKERGSMKISSNSKNLQSEEEFLLSSLKLRPQITKRSSNNIEIHNTVLLAHSLSEILNLPSPTIEHMNSSTPKNTREYRG